MVAIITGITIIGLSVFFMAPSRRATRAAPGGQQAGGAPGPGGAPALLGEGQGRSTKARGDRALLVSPGVVALPGLRPKLSHVRCEVAATV